ncbi:MAG: alanine racemase [Clostridiales bacterium]|nr:alanine racemase [Clostridiales bacterium]
MNRTWAEIDIDALKYNITNIKSIIGKSRLMAVVKADAYGHGYRECCRVMAENGADSFAVAMLDEAKEIRRAGLSNPILILGASCAEEADEIINYDIMPNVSDMRFAKVLSESAVRLGKTVKVHLKIDTGMSRVGFVAGEDNSELIREILRISKLPGIEIDGIFSHFACADEANSDYTYLQFNRFIKLTGELEAAGLKIPCRHIANSAAIMMYPEMHLDMVRAGVILYGYYPSDEVDKTRLSLKPVMTLKSRVSFLKTVESGVGVSYGKTYITDRNTKIATIPVGYADGYLRCLSQKAKMETGGKLCEVIGRICMDQCMIDVTNVNNINVGDEVIIFGNGLITADNIAEWMSTINYEVLCLVSKRIPRIYKEKGRERKELNYLEKL